MRALDRTRRLVVPLLAALVMAYLYAPVAVVVAFSFNDPTGRINVRWEGFTLDNWTGVCSVPGLCDAVLLSMQIAALATIGATLLGVGVAFAMARYRFRGRASTNLLIFLPLATPEVVMASSLLALFVNAGAPLGFGTILIAHVLFCISFVVVVVKARLATLDPRLEEAAADLYAGPRQTFLRVTLPLSAPGIGAGALLAFALSFDDFIVTNFTAGSRVTFPMYVWGAAQRGVPPQVNVIGAAMFLAALGIVLLADGVGRGRRRATAGG